HRKLVLHLRRSREAMQSTAFARGVVGAVDRFLNVPAGFFEHLTHFAGHLFRISLLVVAKDLGQGEQKFRSLWCRSLPPLGSRLLRCRDGSVHVLCVGPWKSPDD